MKQRRTETVTVRLDPETLRAAELVAQVTCRTVSSLMQYALIMYVAKNYPEAMTPGAQVVARIEEAPSEKFSQKVNP
jgi:predicted transcriptional regulator